MTATRLHPNPTTGRSGTPGRVAVLARDGRREHPSVRWAAAEAHRRGVPLEVLITADAPAVTAPAEGGRTTDALQTRSVDAALIVVPADLPELAEVVARAHCPVVVVPEQPTTAGGAVVVGVAPWTSEEAVELAFAEADGRHTRLVAVRAWDDPVLDLSWWRPDRMAEWDRTELSVRRELEWVLSAERTVHPDVAVRPVVAEDRPADLLLALSAAAQLLVLGRSERGTLLAGSAGSPVAELLRAAGCPLVVVPAGSPPAASWLPSRSRARAIAHR